MNAIQIKKISSQVLLPLWVVLFVALFGSGCYTQLATYEPSTGGTATYSGDEEIRKKAQQRDTIRIRDREYCVWTRDFFGDPVLRCYDSRYSWQWHDYYYEPWWYRQSPWWNRYEHRRCPRYYYYDPACGCCRYYKDRPYSGGGSGGSGSGGGSGVPSEPPPLKSRSGSSPGNTTSPGSPKQQSTGDGALYKPGNNGDGEQNDQSGSTGKGPPLKSRGFGVRKEKQEQDSNESRGANQKKSTADGAQKKAAQTNNDSTAKENDKNEKKDQEKDTSPPSPPLLGR